MRALAAAALTLVAALGLSHPSVEAHPSVGAADTIDLTFDWPLDCAVAVEQETLADLGDGSVLIGASYDVELVDTPAPDDVEARFGTPTIDDVLIDDADAPPPEAGSAQYALIASYVSNPTLAVALDGTSALDIGFDSWLEDSGVTPQQFGRSEDQLRDLVDYRATWSTWATWVGRWADLATVAPGSTDVEVSDRAEYGATTESPVTVDVEPAGDGLVTLRATSTLDDAAVDQLWRYGGGVDPATEVAERDGEASRVTEVEVVTDPATLRPRSASYEVTLSIDGEVTGSVSHAWTFTWPDCGDAVSVGDLDVPAPPASTSASTVVGPQTDVYVPPGFDTVTVDELPPEARDTLALIDEGGPFPYERDGVVFGNFEGILPDEPRGYYHEYTVETPGSRDRGARRIVTGASGEIYYTDDHYESFLVVLR